MTSLSVIISAIGELLILVGFVGLVSFFIARILNSIKLFKFSLLLSFVLVTFAIVNNNLVLINLSKIVTYLCVS